MSWKSSFLGIILPFLLIYNNLHLFNKQISIYNFTDFLNYSAYKKNTYNIPLKLMDIEFKKLQNSNSLNSKEKGPQYSSISLIRAKRSGDIVRVALPYSSSNDIVIKLDVFRTTTNHNVNLIAEYLVPKNGNILSETNLFKESPDDIAPNLINGSYIGGNHGWNQPLKLTKKAHGKTFADIGAIATDAVGNEFTIMQIIDPDNFVLCGRNKATDGYSYNFPNPIGDLKFPKGVFSGFTIQSVGNLYNFTKSIERKVLVNGNTELSKSNETKANFIDIIDTYDVYDLSSVIDRLIKLKGTFSANPDYTSIGADKLFKQSVVYRFTGNTILINESFFNYKKLNLDFIAFLQLFPMNSGKLYINKTKPIKSGSTTYDFRIGSNWSTAPSAPIYLNKADWESPNNAPDRWISYDNNKALAIGFIKDKGNYKIERSSDNSAGWLNTSLKIYPYYKKGTGVLNAGNTFSSQAFRNYQDRTEYISGRISKVDFFNQGEYYLILDYNSTVSDSIELPKELLGRNIEIVEKTPNIQVLNKTAVSELKINVVTDPVNVYGYVTIKIKK